MKSVAYLAPLMLLAIAPPVRAEIMVAESIEWVIADSERVFVGKLVKVERVGGHEAVTVDVSKTLRGKHDATVTFLVPEFGGRHAQGWPQRDVPMLFCLVKRAQLKDADLPEDAAWVVRRGVLNHSAFFLAKPDSAWAPLADNVYTRDFNVLTEPAPIIKYVEAYAKSLPAEWKKKSTLLHVPHESPAHGLLWRRSSVVLAVPLDPQIEVQARAWCNDKSLEARARGARMLGNFKNDANIKLLKSLLRDPAFDTISGSEVFTDRIVRREYQWYTARAAAYDALRELGVAVEQPIVEITLKRTEERIPAK